MIFVRPFDVNGVAKGTYSDWLIAPDEGAGISVRLRRGENAAIPIPTIATAVERYALVMEGAAALIGKSRQLAKVGEVILIPAGELGAFAGREDSVWAEIEVPLPAGKEANPTTAQARVIPIDQSRFEGGGFAYESGADRTTGAQTLRMDVLQVQPGFGGPDYHIHVFAQIYVIQDGAMTIDVGRARMVAKRNSVVVLPAGVVHRNFNASTKLNRHMSLLVPAPQ